jgi:hypothetical protein
MWISGEVVRIPVTINKQRNPRKSLEYLLRSHIHSFFFTSLTLQVTMANPKQRIALLRRFVAIGTEALKLQNFALVFAIGLALVSANLTPPESRCCESPGGHMGGPAPRHPRGLGQAGAVDLAARQLPQLPPALGQQQGPLYTLLWPHYPRPRFVPFCLVLSCSRFFPSPVVSSLTLVYICEGNPDTLQGLINFSKWEMYAKQFNGIMELQNRPCQVRVHPDIQRLLDDAVTIQDDELYKYSKFVESPDNPLRELRRYSQRMSLPLCFPFFAWLNPAVNSS